MSNPQYTFSRPLQLFKEWKRQKVFYVLLLLLSGINLQVLAQPSGFVDEIYVSGFDQAVGLAFDENNRMYVWEKGGKVWIVENGVKSTNPLIDISQEVGNWRDYGCLGFALDPDFLTNGFIYLLYTVDRHHLLHYGTSNYNVNSNSYFKATIGRVTRYTTEIATGFTSVDYNSRLVLMGQSPSTGMPHLHESHGVGSLVFGKDGTLMVSMGDGASYNSVDQGSASETYYAQALSDGIITAAQNVGAYRCQRLDSHNGKIFRIDPATGDGVPSNPFYNASSPRAAQSRTWALGLRNPCRMSLKPDTGSHFPEDGDPGVLLIGDVGWGNREETNVCDAPGLNFGWPRHEGIDYYPGYNNSAYYPAVHTRPKLHWRTGATAKAYVNGSTFSIGSSQVPGPGFGGNCAIGGAWYNGNTFPAAFQNKYFQADFGDNWIKAFSFDSNYNPTEVQNFKSDANNIVFVKVDPLSGALYWIGDGGIHKITYNPNGNLSPMAVATADLYYGTGPLTVSFSSAFSYDPEGGNLSYNWEFGDGNSSTLANPNHTYSTNSLQSYSVNLTVTDNGNNTDQTTIDIHVNNTPPQIISTSLDGITTVSSTNATTLNLNAVVSDAEHNSSQLTYVWRTALFHNNHNHNDPDINAPSGSTVLSPVGCDGITYWYRITLIVSDPMGLSSTFVKDIYPDCSGQNQTISFPPISDKSTFDLPFSINPTASSGLPVSTYLIQGPAALSGNNITLTGIPGIVTIRAVQGGGNGYKPAIQVEQSFWVTPANSSCNAAGQILMEKWSNIGSSNAIAAIPLNNSPTSTTNINSFQIPINVDNNYGVRVRGYICPPVSGEYTFWIASDDNGELWLSTDDNPSNKNLIANVPEWTSSNEWDKFSSQQSSLITLQAGQQYYIEALMKEGGGGDNLSVGWQLPSGLLQRPILGGVLSPFAPKQNQSINFNSISDKLTSDIPFSISATATSNLPVTFNVVSGPATVSGNMVTLNGETGTVTIQATQDGNIYYYPAALEEQSFIVNASGSILTINSQINAASDDAEERTINGLVKLNSTDLELIQDNSNVQKVGLRFNGLNIPQGAVIANAYIQFTTDEVSTNASTLTIKGQDSNNAVTFIGSTNNISQRSETNASITWQPEAWSVEDVAGLEQRTPNLSPIIQEIVDRSGWAAANSLVILIEGSGTRTAKSYDGSPTEAPVLTVAFYGTGVNIPPMAVFINSVSAGYPPLEVSFDASTSNDTDGTITNYDWDFGDGNTSSGISPNHTFTSVGTFTVTLTVTDNEGATATAETEITVNPLFAIQTSSQVNSESDDAEEDTFGGKVKVNSTDLELIQDNVKTQVVGLRFTGLNIPQGALITNAYVQFTVDEVSSGATSLTIRGEASDDAATFVNSINNLSSRSLTLNNVSWQPTTWNSANVAGSAQQTPPLNNIIQEIIDRPGWTQSSSLALLIDGSGERTVESFEGSASGAPVLHIEYQTTGGNLPPFATFSATPTDGFTPLEVAFDASASNDVDGTIVSYDWDFGDGSTDTGISPAHTYISEGTYPAILILTDNNGATDSYSIPINVIVPGAPLQTSTRVNTSSDDAEENSADGTISLKSSDLELIQDNGLNQVVGIRFNDLDIPPDATISNAYIQFTVDESNSPPTALTISGEARANAITFEKTVNNISSRPKTISSVTWQPQGWNTVGLAGPQQQSPDLKTIVQEIIDHPNWAATNSLAFIIEGSGERTAESFNGSSEDAPMLLVEYTVFGGTPPTPFVRPSRLGLHAELFPNPFEDKFHIKVYDERSESFEVQIVDGSGRVLFNKSDYPVEATTEIEASLPSGTYFIRVTSGLLHRDFKVIKQRD